MSRSNRAFPELNQDVGSETLKEAVEVDDTEAGVISTARTSDDPITTEEINENRQRARKNTEDDELQIRQTPQVEDGQEIVAHATNTTDSGTNEEMFVVAGDDTTAEDSMRELADLSYRAAAERESPSPEIEVSTQNDIEWTQLNRSVFTYRERPAGRLRVTVTVKKGDRETGQPLFGVKQKAEMIPGSIIDGWGSNYVWQTGNDRLQLVHNYEKYAGTSAFVRVYNDGPESQLGSNSYTVSLGGGISGGDPGFNVGFSWSHSEPAAAIRNLSDTVSGDLRWEVGIGRGSAEHTKLEHIPGSSVVYYPPDGPYREMKPIVELQQQARFKRFQGPPPGPSWYPTNIGGSVVIEAGGGIRNG